MMYNLRPWHLQVPSVTIAKMDGTENEHPEAEAKGFPTLLFYPAGDSKKAITFEGGDRSLKVCTGRRACWGSGSGCNL